VTKLGVFFYIFSHKYSSPDEMFSWSHNSLFNSNNQDPGSRVCGGTQHGAPATVVEGSIRHPLTLTRAQHLESYLQHAMLSKFTGRVSAHGTFLTLTAMKARMHS